MMKRFWQALIAAGIACAVNAAPPPMELTAPRDGAVLEGGREASLTWSSVSLPDEVKEWEAFLSLDGGKYYAVRITPHLDLSTRSFRWRVPNVGASSARILIRVGDEQDERPIEFYQTFRIVARATPLDLADARIVATEAAGEAAMPAGPPVIEWVSGDRSGRELVTHQHRDRASVAEEHVLADEATTNVAQLSNVASLQRPGTGAGTIVRIVAAVGRPALPFAPQPLLLLTTRLNI